VKKMSSRIALLAIFMLALSALPDTELQAQTVGRTSATSAVGGEGSAPIAPDAIARGADDMRLWSFGECDRRFPSVSSDEHRQCVRVVGSEEARDARAYRVCDISHERDRAEAARCKSAYTTNKEKAAQGAHGPNGTAQAPDASAPEVLQRVRAIAEAAVEQDRDEAAATTEPAETPAELELQLVPGEPQEFWSPMTVVGALSLCMLVFAFTAIIARRKRAGLVEGS
jgi:hypothetical protein